MDRYVTIVETFLAGDDNYTETKYQKEVDSFLSEFNLPTGLMLNLLYALKATVLNNQGVAELYLNKYNQEKGI